jgi:hypothetical protein
MPRSISATLRRDLEEPRSNEYLVILLEITHPSLAIPIRVANDVVAYVYESNTYLGFPFEFELLGDGTQVPRGRIRIQNVDRQIGEAVLELISPPELTITILASSDFTQALSDGKRMPIDTPIVEYQASHLVFGNISVDALSISGEIVSFDMGTEPWPAVRTTADRLPGLDP